MFETGRSLVELNKVIRFKSNNPDISIEISGHTDNVGSREYNQELSEKRAKSVLEYLTENGVEDSRLSFAGYGQEQPAFPNDTADNRQKNRRIEFKITD